jgi:hypothetical protein
MKLVGFLVLNRALNFSKVRLTGPRSTERYDFELFPICSELVLFVASFGIVPALLKESC